MKTHSQTHSPKFIIWVAKLTNSKTRTDFLHNAPINYVPKNETSGRSWESQFKMIYIKNVCASVWVFSVQMNVDNSCQSSFCTFFFYYDGFKAIQLIRKMYRKWVWMWVRVCVRMRELPENQYDANSQRNYQIGSCQFDNCRISTLVSFWTYCNRSFAIWIVNFEWFTYHSIRPTSIICA